MQQQTSLPGNTYIQFSFQKSLRKYDKQPHKKIKLNTQYITNSNSHCVNNNHSSSVCRHCVEKMTRKNLVQSNERLVKLQNSRKQEIIKSRNLAREFSQSKRKRQIESSVKRESSAKRYSSAKQTGSIDNNNSDQQKITRTNYHEPLSEFKLDGWSNISIEKVNKQQKQWVQHLEVENGGTIQKIFTQNKLNSEGGDYFGEHGCRDGESMVEQEPDGSFCQIEIGQIAKSNLIPLNSASIEKQFPSTHLSNNANQQITQSDHQDIQTNPLIGQYHQMSYAYFSSCSSLDSCHSDEFLHSQDKKMNEPNQGCENGNDQEINSSDENPFLLLKLESKEELKKECRNEYRERVFYKIKKVNNVEQVLSECQSISSHIQHQLSSILQNDSQSQANHDNQPSIQQTTSLIQANHQDQKDQNLNHQILNAYEQSQNEHSANQPQSLEKNYNQELLQTSPSFQRDRKTFETPYEQSTRRKAMKINFQIEQNYQCLGRIRISGLGEQKQSICLSIRRFSHESSKHPHSANRTNQVRIDKSKMVDYLISQRPYLSKNRQQLISLLQEIVDSQRGNSVAKRLFQ